MYCVTILNIKLIPNFRHVTFKSNKGLGLRVGPGVGLGLGQVNNAGDYKVIKLLMLSIIIITEKLI